jgi:succinate-semialdehyde dehydrogenase/glutarate-semialdehyde dehydrogenase
MARHRNAGRTEKVVSVNPATLESVGEVECTRPDRVAGIVRKARGAQAEWRDAGLAHRVGVLKKAQQLLLDRNDEFGRLITLEMGRPYTESIVLEVEAALDCIGYFAGHGRRHLTQKRLPLHNVLFLRRESRVVPEPLGVMAVITPWNWPLLIPMGCIVPALLAGNAVVFKPSEVTPLVGALIKDLFRDAGVPESVFSIVQGRGNVGEALVGAGVDKVFFTGSTEVGSRIMEQAGRTLTPVVLELGGSDPALVCEDADLEAAASGVVWGAMNNCGQNCNGVERVTVHASVADRFIALLADRIRKLRIGNGMDPDTDMGPLASEAQRIKMETVLRHLRARGGQVLLGGKPVRRLPGHFFEPTLVAWNRKPSEPFQEEIFGPVLTVTTVADDGEAVRFANRSPFGLAASVWTENPARGRAIASRIEAGTVMINDVLVSFGITEAGWTGVKQSGIGWVHGDKGLDEMVNLKYMNRDPLSRGQKFWWFPYSGEMTENLRAALTFLFGKGIARKIRLAPRILWAFGGYLLWNKKRKKKW